MEELDPGKRSFKVTIVGDGGVGKTCLLVSVSQGKFPEDYVPTVFDNYFLEMKYRGTGYYLQLWDTAGQESYTELRKLSYEGVELVLICFDITDRTSFNNIEDVWFLEIQEENKGVPILLVGKCLKNFKCFSGTKSDLRYDDSVKKKKLRKAEINILKEKIKAVSYVECSSRNFENVDLVFETGLKILLDKGFKKKKVISTKKMFASVDKDRGGLSGAFKGLTSINEEDLQTDFQKMKEHQNSQLCDIEVTYSYEKSRNQEKEKKEEENDGPESITNEHGNEKNDSGGVEKKMHYIKKGRPTKRLPIPKHKKNKRQVKIPKKKRGKIVDINKQEEIRPRVVRKVPRLKNN